MSFLKRKLGRSAVIVAFSLGAFQALSFVGATAASALGTCSFSGGAVTVSVPNDGDTVALYLDQNGGIHVAGESNGSYPAFDGSDDLAGCTGVQFGKATTTSINITGGTGSSAFNQLAWIEMSVVNAGTISTTLANWGAINWTVNLGNQDAASYNFGSYGTGGDALWITNDGATTAPLNLVGGANGFDLNGDGDLDVTVANVEQFEFWNYSNVDDQVIDLSGSTATGGPFATGSFIYGYGAGDDNSLYGGTGDDTIYGYGGYDYIGPGLGSDYAQCVFGTGDLDYSNTDTAINLNLAINTVTQGTDLDTVFGCPDATGTAQGDTLIGVDGTDNWFTPGAGNDTVNGGGDGTDEDTYDVSDATDGVTVDLGAGTSTGGSGTDTLSNIEDVNGTDAADVITGDDNDNGLWGNGGNDSLAGGAGDGDGDDYFNGGSATDTVDFSANTLDTEVDLDSGGCQGADGDCDIIEPNTVENARLGSGDDLFSGSAFNNIAFPGGGQNAFSGEGGIDTINYSYGYTAGVTINMTGGGAAGGSQDAIDGFENAVGTAFNDSIFGTDVVAGTNGANSLVGGKGNDSISGNAGPDLIKGGAGVDSIRGGAGDDTVLAQDGNDNVRGSGGADDINGGKGKDYCNGGGGNDFIKNCEKPKHNGHGPNGHNVRPRI